MKKLILALLAVSAITAADAQKNSILVYGSAGVDFSNTDLGGKNGANGDRNTVNYHIAPGIGYQFSKNMTVGLQGGYASTKTELLVPQINAVTQKWSTENDEWTIGAFYRYTKYLSNIFSVYGQVNAGYVSGDIEIFEPFTPSANAMTNGDYDGFQGEIFPAVAINIHKGWALNFGIGGLRYRSLSYNNVSIGTNPLLASFGEELPAYSNEFDITLGQQFNLTVTKNIGCGKWGHRGHRRGGRMEPGTEMRRTDTSDDSDEDNDRPRRRRNRDADEDDE